MNSNVVALTAPDSHDGNHQEPAPYSIWGHCSRCGKVWILNGRQTWDRRKPSMAGTLSVVAYFRGSPIGQVYSTNHNQRK